MKYLIFLMEITTVVIIIGALIAFLSHKNEPGENDINTREYSKYSEDSITGCIVNIILYSVIIYGVVYIARLAWKG